MTGVYESLPLRIGYAKAVLVGGPAYRHVQVDGTPAVASAGRRKKDEQVLHAAIPYHSSKFACVVPCPAGPPARPSARSLPPLIGDRQRPPRKGTRHSRPPARLRPHRSAHRIVRGAKAGRPLIVGTSIF